MNNILTHIEEYRPYLPIYSMYDSLPIYLQILSEMLNDSDLSNKLKMYLNVVRGEREAIHRILRVSYDPELDPKKGNYKLRREVD
jgi:hypothetical protein